MKEKKIINQRISVETKYIQDGYDGILYKFGKDGLPIKT